MNLNFFLYTYNKTAKPKQDNKINPECLYLTSAPILGKKKTLNEEK